MRRRPLLMVAMSALAVASLVGVAFAYFTAKGQGAGSATTGTLKMTNTKNGTYIVSYSGGYPGSSSSGSLTLTNSGTVKAGGMSLTIGTPTDATCAQNGLACPSGVGTSADLSGEATITVTDTTRSTTIISGATIDAAAAHGAYSLIGIGAGANWAVGEAHSFTFTVATPAAAGNTYQGTSTTFAATFNGTVP